MRNDLLQEIIDSSHFILQSLVSVISSHKSTFEIFLNEIQHFTSIKILSDCKNWSYFPSNFDISWTKWERYTETTFAINISGDIMCEIFQGLRIMVRFHRIILSSIHHLRHHRSDDDSSRYGFHKLPLMIPTVLSSLHHVILEWHSGEDSTVISRIYSRPHGRDRQYSYPTRTCALLFH